MSTTSRDTKVLSAAWQSQRVIPLRSSEETRTRHVRLWNSSKQTGQQRKHPVVAWELLELEWALWLQLAAKASPSRVTSNRRRSLHLQLKPSKMDHQLMWSFSDLEEVVDLSWLALTQVRVQVQMVKVETSMSFRPFAISLRINHFYRTVFLPWELTVVAFTVRRTLQPLVESANSLKKQDSRPRSRCFLIRGNLLMSKSPNYVDCTTTISTQLPFERNFYRSSTVKTASYIS